jgi:hypothetical protein
MSDTMRRIRSYRHGTNVRKSGIEFQYKMLRYLVQPNKHPVRLKNKAISQAMKEQNR